MVAINFQERFVPAILSGAKRQTIRLERRHWVRLDAGSPLHLFTGMRTKGCRRIGTATVESISQVMFDLKHDLITGEVLTSRKPRVENFFSLGALHSLNQFAQLDGFCDWAAMRGFFLQTYAKPGLQLQTRLIVWTDFAPCGR